MRYTLGDYDFHLPPERIAQTGAEPRDSSKLLVVPRHGSRLEHRVFADILEYLRAGDVMVFNQTRVIPARLAAHKIPGSGAAEILLIERIDDRHWLTMVGGKNIHREALSPIQQTCAILVQSELLHQN